ncbi:rho-type gtpase-activating protein [Ophiostoma piceae UAMH 11346]|uniref:Rho-type gtpase-activating protein n=1 Tax=Ophiostoma piceae (strain UAMH 11346) TaxID=1262450 RepID=S3C2U8_OPHP1|nr:rho-type gtpase-activating protein [Ophiostoma piceae UAMH 11346]
MAALDEYQDGSMDAEDIFPCKGCGEILEEGKAFELAGHRWHLNCFRCNSCGTLLDSDANLLLLGDGSLICNNCTYSCSACGNKIEDLAILTGEQAFCATCFRCRNCKRKIENLRYARTSQGIFCMSCHESLMARRRKKHKAAAQAKAREKEGSPMITDKSLPALPPSTPTELSPRPRPPYGRNDSSLSSMVRAERSPDRSAAESISDGKSGLTLPASNYRANRSSAMFGGSVDLGGSDTESFFIPVALDPSPAPSATPRSASEPKGKERDYFSSSDVRGAESQTSTPHIAFQEKPVPPSSASVQSDYESGGAPTKEPPSRELSKSSRTNISLLSSGASSAGEEQQRASNGRADEFKLQDAPKSKKAASSNRTASQANNSLGSALEFETPKASRRDNDINASPPVSTTASSIGGRSSQDNRRPPDDDNYPDSSGLTTPTSRPSLSNEQHGRSGPIPRKELPTSARNVNGRVTSSPLAKTPNLDDIPAPTLAPPPPPSRPSMSEPKMSDTYMQPRAPPAPPVSAVPPPAQTPSREAIAAGTAAGDPNAPEQPNGPSPKLPRWSSGGDFSLDEDMARILGTDESSSSILRRVSNAVRHGRNSSTESSNFTTGNGISPRGHNRSVSENTRATSSPRWPKTPIAEDPSAAHDISSPISLAVGITHEDPALLKRRLRNSEQRVAELERQFGAEKDLKSLNKKLLEKRRTVSVLDTQAEIMIRQLEVLAGYVERAKTTKQPIDPKELEDSAIKDFVQKLNELQKNMTTTIEQLHAEREELIEEKNQAVTDRDRALLEFEQLSSKNAQLADMNNDLTHQIQERFKSHIGTGENIKSPNGLGIYHTHKGPSMSSVTLDTASIPASVNATLIGTDGEEPIVEHGPTVVNIRKGQVRKFNWKKGSKTVAQNLSKGVNRAVGAFQNDRERMGGPYQGLTGDSIGLPYNMTVASQDTPVSYGTPPPQQVSRVANEHGSISGNSGGRGISGPISGPTPINPSMGGPNTPANNGFGFFKKSGVQKSGTATSVINNPPPAAAEAPSTLFGSDLVERAEYERRQIPSVVTRCIEEVELRGMDIEGIYRKTGGNSQVKSIQEGFEKQEDYDISDPGLDITAVTSVLKQYFRKLPNPLLTFDIYDNVLESISIADHTERCAHLRKTFNMLPPKHRDCLEFLMFHIARVAQRERENLMSPKNLAVVFAPTILHHQNIEREMIDTRAKNLAVQFVIENSDTIFAEA